MTEPNDFSDLPLELQEGMARLTVDMAQVIASAWRAQHARRARGDLPEPDTGRPKQDKMRSMLRDAGAGPRHIRLAMQDALADARAMREVTAYVRDTPCWCLILSGPPGVGKTAAAVYGLRLALYDAPPTVVTPRVYSLHDLSRRQFDKSAREELDRLNHVDMLILDDLGVEKDNEWLSWWLYDLMDKRWRGERRTIITTNLTKLQLKERYDDRIVDRLQEGRYVPLTGKSMREDNF